MIFMPTDALEIDVRASWSNLDGGAVMDASMPPGDPANANREVAPRSDILGNSEREITDATVKLDWRTDYGTLTSITGYTDLTEDYYGDLDFCNPVDCPAGIFGLGPQADQAQHLDVELLSQELRFVSPDDRDLRWIVGAFYINTKRDLETIGNFLFPGAPPFTFLSSNESNDNDAYSVFAQVDYDFTDRTTLGVSLRYDKDEREQTDVNSGAVRDISFDEVQPRAVLSHKFTDDQMGYVSYGTGFRSGGFNGIGGRPFDAETLQNYEIGYKSEWLDNRLRLNAAVFHSISDDYQFFYVDFAAGGAQVIDNLKKVEFTGGGARVAGAGHARLAGLRLARHSRLGHQGDRRHAHGARRAGQQVAEDAGVELHGRHAVRVPDRRPDRDTARRLQPDGQALLASRQRRRTRSGRPARSARVAGR